MFVFVFINREFTLAEIEHFVDPCDKSHPKFENVSSQNITLYPSENQIDGKPPVNISLEDAVNQVSDNSSHGYFPVARGTLSRISFSLSCRVFDVTQINNVCNSFATWEQPVFVFLRTLFTDTALLINLLLYFATLLKTLPTFHWSPENC